MFAQNQLYTLNPPSERQVAEGLQATVDSFRGGPVVAAQPQGPPPPAAAATASTILTAPVYQIPGNRRTFINETHAVFLALQDLYFSTQEEEGPVMLQPEMVRQMTKLHREAIQRQIAKLSQEVQADQLERQQRQERSSKHTKNNELDDDNDDDDDDDEEEEEDVSHMDKDSDSSDHALDDSMLQDGRNDDDDDGEDDSHVRSVDGTSITSTTSSSAESYSSRSSAAVRWSELTTFTHCSTIWHLFEIIFTTPVDGRVFASEYLAWLNRHYPEPSVAEGEAISEYLGDPTEYPGFWPYLTTSVLRGHTALVLTLLGRLREVADLTSAEKYIVSVAQESVRDMPSPHDPTSAAFMGAWQRWKKECQRWSTDPELAANSRLQPLQPIFAIMAGHTPTINAYTQTWQECFGAILHYCDPTVDILRMPDYLENCRSIPAAQDSSTNSVDQALLALLRGNISKVVANCSRIDAWLVTHMIDIFHKLGHLDDLNESIHRNARDFFVLSYGETLLSVDSFWQAGIAYLASCSTTGTDGAGPETIAAYLVRQPLDSERRIRKILALLQRYGQPEAYALVCRSVARQRLDRGLYGPAIAYYMRANEPRRVAHIADELLLNYIRTGDLGQYTPIIDNLGPQNQLFSDHLQFLSQYRDFHEHSQRKEWVKAGQVLVGLLTTQVAPKKFWFIMLVDAIPLLEGDELVLNSQDTSELMRCLEEITSSHLNQQYLQLTSPLWLKSKDKSIANGRIPIDQQLEIVRMTLVRNLARSLLYTTN